MVILKQAKERKCGRYLNLLVKITNTHGNALEIPMRLLVVLKYQGGMSDLQDKWIDL